MESGDFSTFANSANPLRCSSLVNLVQCSKSVILRAMINEENEAAQTGSLIHLGINVYHKERKNELLALTAMAVAQAQFPLSNGAKAKKHFEQYTRRERKEWGEIILCEEKVRFQIPPATYDPTQEEIYVEGTLDQLRKVSDGLLLVDVKTGSKRAAEMIHYYAMQIVAYQYAAQQMYPGELVKAAILRTADFIYGGPVLHFVPWEPHQTAAILETVRHEVAQVRAGRVVLRPGGHCQYCPARGIGNCKAGVLPSNELPGELPSLTEMGDL